MKADEWAAAETARWEAQMSRTPMTTDPRIAALAAALVPLLPQHQEGSGGYPHQSSHRTWTVYDWMDPDALAAAILAALPDDWCGHDEDALLNRYDLNVVAPLEVEIATLRAALDGLVEAATGYLACDGSGIRAPEPWTAPYDAMELGRALPVLRAALTKAKDAVG